jgi:hypothetical protein
MKYRIVWAAGRDMLITQGDAEKAGYIVANAALLS